MLAPLPRCSTTVSARGRALVELRQHRGDVLVRQAVEAVAPHAGFVQLRGQREALRDVGIGAVERGIEAGDLRQLRRALEQAPDRREVVRLMQRRERNQLLERRHHVRIDAHRLREVEPAVHDAMSDADQLVAARRSSLQQIRDR